MKTKLSFEDRRGKANHEFAKKHHDADYIYFDTTTKEPVAAIYYNKGSEAYLREETRSFFQRIQVEMQERYGSDDD